MVLPNVAFAWSLAKSYSKSECAVIVCLVQKWIQGFPVQHGRGTSLPLEWSTCCCMNVVQALNTAIWCYGNGHSYHEDRCRRHLYYQFRTASVCFVCSAQDIHCLTQRHRCCSSHLCNHVSIYVSMQWTRSFYYATPCTAALSSMFGAGGWLAAQHMSSSKLRSFWFDLCYILFVQITTQVAGCRNSNVS